MFEVCLVVACVHKGLYFSGEGTEMFIGLSEFDKVDYAQKVFDKMLDCVWFVYERVIDKEEFEAMQTRCFMEMMNWFIMVKVKEDVFCSTYFTGYTISGVNMKRDYSVFFFLYMWGWEITQSRYLLVILKVNDRRGGHIIFVTDSTGEFSHTCALWRR